MGTHRSSSSRVIGVHSLRPTTIGMIQEQADVRGLSGDPLPEVVTALRTEQITTTSRWFGGSRETRRTTELLLTPEVLVIVTREGRDATAEASQVAFHLLAAAALTAGAEGGLALAGAPVGASDAGPWVLPLDDGPESSRFHEALVDALDRARPGAHTGGHVVPGPRHGTDVGAPDDGALATS